MKLYRTTISQFFSWRWRGLSSWRRRVLRNVSSDSGWCRPGWQRGLYGYVRMRQIGIALRNHLHRFRDLPLTLWESKFVIMCLHYSGAVLTPPDEYTSHPQCGPLLCFFCLLWINKARAKDKRYIWVSVWHTLEGGLVVETKWFFPFF